MSLQHKIDFAVIFTVKNANPNGDPLNGNRPRTTLDGNGELSDVCLKRKIRNRLLDSGVPIFVQSDDHKIDTCKTLKDRASILLEGKKTREEQTSLACRTWFDVRAFGQLFAYKGTGEKKNDGVSIGIRGPVTIQAAFSVEPVEITSTQITKSVSGEGDGTKKASDTMGMKHRVDQGVYVFYGAISPQLASLTGFSDEDAEILKNALPFMFEGDASSARPEGSMEVKKVIWWQHSCPAGQYSSAKVHRSLIVHADGTYKMENLPGLTPEEIDGF
ncbi:type I-C CRISPR-associated protein Cas7/Csd2 [Akkermansia muciniphila]|jgi:CRISPR-associated protein Csd2|uniref:type I-C CRISPR-associated protein Cas7/Csd2 n=1 Tax=Akkermansia TaxID=239934 RepID=UPI000C9CB776|nr:type I-C CRISPR-associated protein Cas7/Csd2 [Akkermansia massiliensis]MCO8186920.1 type I-C CRISPR-associated protein Cas7/Csd2 [Akkermansia massiliensis]PNC22904.1 type I-C CRISPR-associated protein Cas7/Csd2 [Akkermansia muciniphila]PNC38796.1 type I-C CRISPR-associated protein Cas7/Csd2 [Akkermansia muciniphila]